MFADMGDLFRRLEQSGVLDAIRQAEQAGVFRTIRQAEEAGVFEAFRKADESGLFDTVKRLQSTPMYGAISDQRFMALIQSRQDGTLTEADLTGGLQTLASEHGVDAQVLRDLFERLSQDGNTDE